MRRVRGKNRTPQAPRGGVQIGLPAVDGPMVARLLLLASLGPKGPLPMISAAPGSLVRWRGEGTIRCGMNGRFWAALRGACYSPIDLEGTSATQITVSPSGP